MKIKLRSRKKNAIEALMLACAFMLFGLNLGHAQDRVRVSGQVSTLEDNEPLPGVTVLEKGTNNGAITDAQGNYTLQVAPDAVLAFSFLGYVTQEMPVNNRSTIDITLVEDIQQLQEVVVVGYGTVRKSDLTGAVVSIKPEEMTAGGANLTVEQMLQGRVPGVNIQSKSGEPGGAISVRIRGASSITAGNQPLYVVDGVPFNTNTQITSSGSGFVGNQNPRNPLNTISPNDIASIEVLKDASATAIYGSRGSNGVVLITTKGGNKDRLTVNYGYARSLQEITNEYELLNAHQYQEVLNAILDEGASGARVEDFQGDGINWPELIYRDGAIDEHNLSVAGGNENTDFYVALNVFDQEGILINSGIERYNLRLNLNTKFNEKFKMGTNLNTSYIKDDFFSNGTGVNENAGALYAALYYDPTLTRIIDPFTGRFTTNQNQVIDNPLALALHETAEQRTYRTFGSMFMEYFIIPGLSAKVRIGGDVSSARRDVWVGPETLDGVSTGGIGTIINRTNTYHLGEFTLNFNEDFGDHAINAVAGVTYEEFNTFNNSAEGSGFLFPDLRTNALGSGADTLEFVGSGRAQAKLNSFLGRVNYIFKDKYLLTVSGRADGSSRFGPNNRVAFFPSAAVAWKMHEEPFFQRISQVSELKLRASYGAIGNQAIPNNIFLTLFEPGPGAVFGNTIFGSIEPKIVGGETLFANPGLKWEAAVQLDIGIDFGLFDSRVQGTIDYYQRDTKDLLLEVPLATSIGFDKRVENLGEMQNRGIELGLSGYVIDRSNFKWEVAANFTTLTNEVTDLGPVAPFGAGDLNFARDVARVEEGIPLFSYLGYIVDGVWQTEDDFSATKTSAQPGDWKYRDVNGDSLITSDDKVILGDSFHDIIWGLTNTVTYKGFTLSVYLEGAHGAQLLNQNLVNTFYPITFRNNRLAEPYLNRWTENNPTNEYSSFVRTNTGDGLQVNSRTVEDASYIRLQSVRLSYAIPLDEFGIDFIKSIDVSLTGQNLKTWTDYSGVDPAVNSFGNNNIPMDFNAYPFARTYTVGVNIGF